MDPLTVLTAVGVGLSAFGLFKSGSDQAAMYKYNQALAEYKAEMIDDMLPIQLRRHEQEVAQYIGRVKTLQGASGTATGEGTNLDAIVNARKEAEFDAAIIRYNAEVAKWSAQAEGASAGMQANQMLASGVINAGASLLTGISKWDWKGANYGSPYGPDYTAPGFNPIL